MKKILLLTCIFFLATGFTWAGSLAEQRGILELDAVWSISEGALDCRGICTVQEGSSLHIRVTLQASYEGRDWSSVHDVTRFISQSGRSETLLSAPRWDPAASYRVKVSAEAFDGQNLLDSEVRYAYIDFPKT